MTREDMAEVLRRAASAGYFDEAYGRWWDGVARQRGDDVEQQAEIRALVEGLLGITCEGVNFWTAKCPDALLWISDVVWSNWYRRRIGSDG